VWWDELFGGRLSGGHGGGNISAMKLKVDLGQAVRGKIVDSEASGECLKI